MLVRVLQEVLPVDQLVACCETDLGRDLHRYLGTGVEDKSEGELLAEIKKIAVITRINLVNVVSLMSAAQEHGESCRSYLARIRSLANQYLQGFF